MNRKERLEIFDKNIGLVKIMSSRFYIRNKTTVKMKGLTFDDIKQQAYLTMWECIPKFNKNKGYKFSTYSACSINLNLRKYIARYNIVHIPRKEQWENKINKKNIETLKMLYSKSLTSINKEIGDNICIKDTLYQNEDFTKYIELKNTIEKVLNKKELDILKFHISEIKQNEIAKKLKSNQSTISRTIRKIKNKIKNIYLEEEAM